MNHIASFLANLRPEPRLTVTQWADKYRRLSTKGAAEPGQYSSARTPYLIKIMDVLSFISGYTRIILMKGVQLGATEAGFNLLGYIMDIAPGPAMYVMPTRETMLRMVKQRIDPMIADSPRLLLKIGQKRSKDGGNTLTQKEFNGGTIIFTGANSAAGLASFPARTAVLDEVDRFPGDVDGEGDPVSLAEKRQVTFGDSKKTFIPSTPTIQGASRIETEFNLTDQHYYHIPCPHCQKTQTLEFENMRWEHGIYTDVHFLCIHCAKKIYNRHKTYMLSRGQWIPSHPELSSPRVIGFHLSALYSPEGWLTWEEIAKEFDNAENDEPKLKTLYNTILARTYRIKGDAPPWQQLHMRAQSAPYPRNTPWPSVAFLTAGVDVQGDRLEIEIIGWMMHRCSQQIDYRVIPGDPAKDEVWEQLGDILNETFTIAAESLGEAARTLQIRLMAIDSNYSSAKVHDFCKLHGLRKAIPIQGRDHLLMPYEAPKAVTKTKQGKPTGKVKVWGIGVSYLKEQLYGWLRLQIPLDGPEAGIIPRGYCHFLPADSHYFKGLTAEELVQVTNKKNNALKYEWQKKYLRNEPLDCRIYGTAAAYIIGFDRWNEKAWQKMTSQKTHPQPTGTGTEEIAEHTSPQPTSPPPSPLGEGRAEAKPPEQKTKKPKRSKGGFWN